MNGPDIVVYEFTCWAWDTYRREQSLPVKSLPELVANDDEVLGGPRKLIAALRRVLTPHKHQAHPRVVGHKALAQ